MNVLAFDIETVPDVDAGRRLYGLEAIQIGRQCQLRSQAFVAIVHRDNALPQLVFRDLYAARV